MTSCRNPCCRCCCCRCTHHSGNENAGPGANSSELLPTPGVGQGTDATPMGPGNMRTRVSSYLPTPVSGAMWVCTPTHTEQQQLDCNMQKQQQAAYNDVLLQQFAAAALASTVCVLSSTSYHFFMVTHIPHSTLQLNKST